MSHPATAHVAAWLGGSSVTDGSVAFYLASAGKIPVYGTDALPAAPTVYNEWQHDWVAFGNLPDEDDTAAAIATPCLAVLYRGQQFNLGPDAYEQTGGSIFAGTIDLSIIAALRGEVKSENMRNAGYYARAVLGSLLALGYGTDTQRLITATGMRLGRPQSFKRGHVQSPKGDYTLLSAWDVTYAITETVPVSL